MTKLSAVVLFIVSLSVSAVLAAEPQVFKNSDLEKYSTRSGAQVAEPPRQSDNGEQQNRGAGDESSASPKYWCDTATEADNRIKKAEENLSTANARKFEAWSNLGKGIYTVSVEAEARAQKNLEGAQTELAEAKQQKERLEDDSRQKNIPAGWLRCQFE